MDQRNDVADGNTLWLSSTGNGHSNSALGGAFTKKLNIFDYTHGRPAARNVVATNSKPSNYSYQANLVYDMGLTSQNEHTIGMGPRGLETATNIQPESGRLAFNESDWGASVAGGTDADAFLR